MKTKEDFIDYYKSSFCKILAKDYKIYHDKYLKKKKSIILGQGILMILVILCTILMYNQVWSYQRLFLSVFFLLVFFICLLIVNIYTLRNAQKICMAMINESIYRNILRFISNNDFLYEGNTQLAYEDFMKMGLFNLNLLNYMGKNFTASSIKGKKFLFCDVTLYDLKPRMKVDHHYDSKEDIEYIYQYHYHEKVDIFKGLYYETTIKRKNNRYIYLIPNNLNDLFIRRHINYYITYHGDRVELENLAFEKKYNVYSVDEIKSRYILSMTLMEKINTLDEKIPQKKYFVFKPDGRLGIYIDKMSIEKMFHCQFDFRHMPSLNYLISFFEKVNNLFYISTIFDEE